MEEHKPFLEPLMERAEAYRKTTYELLQLKAIDKTSALGSTLISRALAILVFIFFLLSATIGVALWLGEVLGKVYYGFFCVAGFYGVIGVMLYFFVHSYLKRKIGDSIVSQIHQSITWEK